MLLTMESRGMSSCLLYYLIARFLASGPCKAASAALSTELNQHYPDLLPSRYNWKGESQPLSLDELTSRNSHIASSHLHDLLQKLVQHTDTLLPPPGHGTTTLLGHGDASLLRTTSVHNEKPYNPRAPQSRLAKHIYTQPKRSSFNSSLALTARELGGNVLKNQRQPTFVSKYYKELVTLFGHRFPIYCVTFDKAGLRVITGSDDYLVKIWCATTGYLIYTLRGHQKEITDLTLNEENTLLATTSTDGIIRVWSMKDFRPIAVLTSGAPTRKGFTTVNFSPSPMSDTRYLMATSEDGMVRLWKWDRKTLQFFNPNSPITFPCRFRLKDQVRCASFNRSGTQFAVAGDDGIVHVFSTLKGHTRTTDYSLNSNSQAMESGSGSELDGNALRRPKKKGRPSLMQNMDLTALESSNILPVANLEGHHGSITDIAYSHDGKKVLSGCMDGTARVWYVDQETNEWKSLTLDIKEKSEASAEQGNQQPNRENHRENQADNQATLPVQPPPARRPSTAGPPAANNDANNEPLATAANGPQSTTTEQNNSENRPDVQMTDETENDESAPSYNMRLRRSTNNQEQNYNIYDPSNTAAIEAQAQVPSGPPSRESAYVSMIAWNLDDTACIIATTYGDIKVFDSETGELLGTLIGHTEETYAVDVHPSDCRTILSAGYDGRAILWDLATFTQISCHYYPERNLLDCKFSKDGTMYAVTDSEGKCVLYGVGRPIQPYAQTRSWHRGQQFWTDFLPVRYDEHWNFIDEQTQLPPHMMDRSLIIDWGGVEYPRQKPAGYGRNLPLTNKYFEMEEAQRRAWYNEEMQQNKPAHVPALPKVSRAKGYKKRKDFVHVEEEETEDLAIFDIPIRAMENDESDDEDYTDVQDGSGSDESESEGSGAALGVDDLGSNGGIDDDEFVEEDEEGESGYRSRRRVTTTRKKKKRRGRPPLNRVGSSSARPSRSTGQRRRGRPRKQRTRNIESDGTESSRHQRRSRNRQISYAEDDDTDKEFIESSSQSEDESEEVDVEETGHTKVETGNTDDEDVYKDEEIDEPATAPSTRHAKRRAVIYDKDDDDEDEDEDEDDDFVAGPSIKRRRLQSVDSQPQTSAPRKRGRPRKNPPPETASAPFEAPISYDLADYEPTDWISTETRQLSPYHPQVDDYVVICCDGHQDYWNHSANLKHFNPKHGPIEGANSMLYAHVTSCQWQVGPPTFCRLKLRLQTLVNVQEALFQKAEPIWQSAGRDVFIDYCDEDNCPEFLVLWSRFQSSMEIWSGLEIGQQVDALYDNGVYPGTIVGVQTECPQWEELNIPSPWQYFHIVWDDPNSPPDDLSPWEVVPRGQDLYKRYDSDKYVPANVKQRAIDVLNWFKDTDEFELFIDHVPWHDYPDYLLQVSYPICINMVLNRINNDFYRHVEAIIDDVEQIRRNAQKYNDETSIVHKNAAKLARMFKGRLQNTSLPLAMTGRGRQKTVTDKESEDEYQEPGDGEDDEEDDDFVLDDADE
ncbi:hypothetical protein INT43_003206 [Umbelopsis isabellina]|uniref:Bromo domain-containing protein n=1 Tax=Mortierella isabellina TaxID=91625 RepID=A0A8H7PPE4_MORIS|nr:hypothetical protein INT43_003206 [Umbelopsis isabellina]